MAQFEVSFLGTAALFKGIDESAQKRGSSVVSLFLTVLSVANIAVGFEERNPLK